MGGWAIEREEQAEKCDEEDGRRNFLTRLAVDDGVTSHLFPRY
jgi:hypothetical protein